MIGLVGYFVIDSDKSFYETLAPVWATGARVVAIYIYLYDAAEEKGGF